MAETRRAVLLLSGDVARVSSGGDGIFATGRSLSVKDHHVDGESIVLTLRQGGEIICDRGSLLIEPDEVPYPEPSGGGRLAAAGSGRPHSLRSDRRSDSVGTGIERTLVRLVKAVIQVESAFQERARSRKGAMGLMQLMPETARQYAVSDPYEPRSNIEAGIKHLKSLLERFEPSLALAAYNAGEGTVRRYGGVPPYSETRNYVSRVLDLAGWPRR